MSAESSNQERSDVADLVPSEMETVRAELAHLRAEVTELRAREKEIVELLGAKSTKRILHDLRNLLNERNLLRAVAGIEDDQ